MATKLCPALCGPMDGSLPGSSVPGISPGMNAGGAAIAFSRGLPDPGVEPGSLEPPELQLNPLPPSQ